ncbi:MULTISPECIES: IS1/IS1595 family N-terminal zinc-binding domain-containing protein [unclassified Microcoleus]
MTITLNTRLKNGRTSSGKQNFKCRDCGRQFVMTPRHQPISLATIMVD